MYPNFQTICMPTQFVSSIQSHLLLKKHGVDGLAAGQDHHGESDGNRHHEAHTDHLRHQVGGEVHQHVAGNVICETDVAKESHLVQREMEGTKYRVGRNDLKMFDQDKQSQNHKVSM